ncbi:bifunctional 2-C-methyl-D-erythritol 4-phosphate cytidylyltransferase/2-C-methyl-D-erythritol 2,4-cyclodiphosphate synthase [Asticcacaulis sp. AND118]|uniref:bifunctional 2-C-methyl-D-erythritol 4-phosphate cytidylyltransferase/2-C-methyl-D-erythritol 2,4-cyclodiphosphate synthase n=1 Tax=Asticcacaulis sp. AND118 TaxID=2840468 RepID=UPI001CFF660D|nr:bifunctional 2-C-methyl-D-erythritol 4-phosphate cytidylyltransferase/2-C-methyl-D-erythritol 2,4-cyclodiphosphate synthase [Asticcacaulis sp. AND118]UDF02354.1 bifunctional 2-C-methyl-D-erythritol 4-phosphate cytidylyltransferase/2-C-methyl-D-erythritol 2,4-cyclodiphosphate synthase [Asticcacaulis sp. AND118]
MTFNAIIVAGGSGQRSGGKKQWMPLRGKPVLCWSIEAFADAGASEIIVVVPRDDLDHATLTLQSVDRVRIVPGGATRALSVQNGLNALHETASPLDAVLIHDAARPLLTVERIEALLSRLETARAAILAVPVTDSLKRAEDSRIIDAPSRAGLWRAQTPQAFRLKDIADAYAAWPGDVEATDEAMVAAAAGIQVEIVEGAQRLQKLTYSEDFAVLEAFMPAQQMRIGQGFDAHRWGPGESVWLCGVEITHEQTLIGHSDADAGLHALTDAILGAAGLGDIGDHFPPTDPQWKGAASDQFLKHAVELIRAKGGEIINVDVTLICERPKIKPHRESMRQRVAEILSVEADRVSIKATTTEKMGFTGREEGLAAQAVCLITLP